jgi:RNA polymerase-binding transcription factor DksA
MDQKITNELKEKLEAQKSSIIKELESFASQDPHSKHNWDTKYPTREDGDKDEAADDAQEYDNKLSVEHSLELKLKDVNTALEKIENGNYGVCEKCGKEIEKERLMAAPEARFCMTHNK